VDAVERAIRNAFEKGDPLDKAYREKVYRAVEAALERALAANPDIDADLAERRRRGLQHTIAAIEEEFQPALPPEPEDAGSVTAAGERPAGDTTAGHQQPAKAAFAQEPAGEGAAITASLAAPVADDRLTPPDETQAERRRHPWTAAFFATILVVAAAMGLWWAADTDLFRSAAERDTSVPNPPAELEPEDFSPSGQAAAPAPSQGELSQAGWIDIFTPADPTAVSAPNDAVAEILEENGERFLRVGGNASGEPVRIALGEGVLERLAGRTAIFSVTARAGEGTGVQMSVECAFGALGGCERKRYDVTSASSDYLFEVELPDREVNGAGAIIIHPDVSGGRNPVDIFAVRVSIR
jgi:hypothetical protein